MIKNIVIMCDYGYIEGGAAKVAIQTALALKKYTDLNIIFVGGSGEICDELKRSGVISYSLNEYDLLGNPSRLMAMLKGIWNKSISQKLKGIIKDLNPKETIIHIHTWTKVLSSSVFQLVNQMEFPLFLTIHDYFTVCPNGGCFNYVKNEICELRPMSFQCLICNCDVRHYYHKMWRCIRQFRQNQVIRKMTDIRYIFVSEFSKRQILKRYSNIQYQFILKNPIEFGNRYRVEVEKNCYFLYIGRLSEEKGVEIFCKAISETGVKGVVIGDGKLKNSLMKQYPDIIFTGWLAKHEMQDWIDKGRCLIFPSKGYENAPLTPLEVQAYGIPCIVSSLCAAVDNISDGVTGLACDINSHESLNQAIEQLKSDQYVKELSFNTFTRFEQEEHMEEKYISRLCQIYNTI
ncbi:MAG: glycosyltransferase family 4 protein [Lachnospiraceae bacterium]|nr:glycosyltransferase family 4 protein [Lachnospiraceae bacterium]